MTEFTADRPLRQRSGLSWQLSHLSWPEFRHQPWRHLTALLAVVLGVALAFSVQLINDSALSEFSAAVRSVNGQPDFELRAQRGGFDETIYARVANDPRVALASPMIELDTNGWNSAGQRVPVRVVGIDPLLAVQLSADLMPQLADNDGVGRRNRLFDPEAVYLNADARRRLSMPERSDDADRSVKLQAGVELLDLPVRGSVAAGGPPLVVMDIAGAQQRFGWLGRLSRIDIRLVPGADRQALLRELALPAGVRAATPAESAQRVSNVSRAYRVNLTVLALVALFTGAFLVFSILSLSVAKRLPQLALLGVLGLSANERLRLVLAESALLGVIGSLCGLALGTGLAALALRLLAGDLGGGYFPGLTPALQFSPVAALIYGCLGVAAAMIGGWLPARIARDMAPAQAIKGMGAADRPSHRSSLGPALLLAGVAMAFAPPIAGLPLAAYAAVALLLLGGIVSVPSGVATLLGGVATPRNPLVLLAIQRSRHQRHTATIAVAGVVASLALAVALTVMVASFRDSVTQWLDTVLPADLYARTAASAAADTAYLPTGLAAAVAMLSGVERVETQRVTQVQIAADQASVALIARPLADPARRLPLVGDLMPVGDGETAAYVSEAMVSLYGAQLGSAFMLPLPDGRRVPVRIAGIWRDYARQGGAVLLADVDFERLTGDRRINDLAIWLTPDASLGAVQDGIRQLVAEPTTPSPSSTSPSGKVPDLIEFASVSEIRALSLRIFDRSFAVTYWLQAVAIGIGLFGIAASFSAQVLARRKEFGLLAHLGLTRRQVLTLVAVEGAVWTAVGTLLGLLLGIAVSVILVKVVNPQSFHWTMDLVLPAWRLAALCLGVMAAGTFTAWIAARAAAGRDLAVSVKEDW